MPFKLRKAPKKELYWVVNTETKEKYSKEPLPKERAQAQMRALYAAEDKQGKAAPSTGPGTTRKGKGKQSKLAQLLAKTKVTRAQAEVDDEDHANITADRALEKLKDEFEDPTVGRTKREKRAAAAEFAKTKAAYQAHAAAERAAAAAEAAAARRAAEEEAARQASLQRLRVGGPGSAFSRKGKGKASPLAKGVMKKMAYQAASDDTWNRSKAATAARDWETANRLMRDSDMYEGRAEHYARSLEALADSGGRPRTTNPYREELPAANPVRPVGSAAKAVSVLRKHPGLSKKYGHGRKLEELLKGAGIFGDIFGKVKKTISGAFNLATKGIRQGYSPSTKRLLDEYSDAQIVELAVRRDPIQSFLNVALNAITLGRWGQAKQELNYDKLFHLGLVVGVKKAGRRTNLIVEKNEVINIAVAKRPDSDTEFYHIPLGGKQMKFGAFMDNAQQAAGKDFFLYDAFENNCQDFVMNLLRANDVLDENAAIFIKQPVDVLLRRLPSFTQKIARSVTDLGAAANVVLEGEGLKKLLDGAGVGHVFQTRFSPDTGFFHRPFEHMNGAGIMDGFKEGIKEGLMPLRTLYEVGKLVGKIYKTAAKSALKKKGGKKAAADPFFFLTGSGSDRGRYFIDPRATIPDLANFLNQMVAPNEIAGILAKLESPTEMGARVSGSTYHNFYKEYEPNAMATADALEKLVNEQYDQSMEILNAFRSGKTEGLDQLVNAVGQGIAVYRTLKSFASPIGMLKMGLESLGSLLNAAFSGDLYRVAPQTSYSYSQQLESELSSVLGPAGQLGAKIAGTLGELFGAKTQAQRNDPYVESVIRAKRDEALPLIREFRQRWADNLRTTGEQEARFAKQSEENAREMDQRQQWQKEVFWMDRLTPEEWADRFDGEARPADRPYVSFESWKAKKGYGRGDVVTMKKKDYVAEHKKLIKLLEQAGKEGKEQKAELAKMTGSGTHREDFLKHYKLPDKSYNLTQLAKISKVPKSILQQVYNRGIGAYKTQPQSVRLKTSFVKNVDAPMSAKLSKEQWGYARVYSFLMGNPKHDEDLRRNLIGGAREYAEQRIRDIAAMNVNNEVVVRLADKALKRVQRLGTVRSVTRAIAGLAALASVGSFGVGTSDQARADGSAASFLSSGVGTGSAAVLGSLGSARLTTMIRSTLDEFEARAREHGAVIPPPGREGVPADRDLEMVQNPLARARAAAAEPGPVEEEPEEEGDPGVPEGAVAVAVPGIGDRVAAMRGRVPSAEDPAVGEGRRAIVFKSLTPSKRAGKKWTVVLTVGGRSRTIHFGAAGMDDFTKTKDKEQKARYIDRHQKREDWTKSGVLTPGFWSRWVLWNLPTVDASLAATRKKFKL